MKNAKALWISVLVLSIGFVFALGLLPMKAYLGWDMPFVELENNSWRVLGWEFVGYEKQLGALFLSGILMMLPARTIPLAIIKLMKNKR